MIVIFVETFRRFQPVRIETMVTDRSGDRVLSVKEGGEETE